MTDASGGLIPLQPIPLLGNDQHCLKFIGFDLIEGDPDAELERGHQIQRATDQQPFLGGLRSLKAVQWAVVTAALPVRSIGTEPWIAQFLAPQRPMHQESKRRIIRPLPG